MKKIISLALATSLLLLFGCAKTGPIQTDTTAITDQKRDADRQTYVNKKDSFSIQFPGGRTFQENIYGVSVMFFSPTTEGDTLKENVGIIKEELDRDYTLDEYYEMTKGQLAELITDFSEVSVENITINDMNAKKLIYKGIQGTTKLKRKQIYIIKNKIVYIITYTATEDTFEQFESKVETMTDTFEIKQLQ